MRPLLLRYAVVHGGSSVGIKISGMIADAAGIEAATIKGLHGYKF